MLSSTVNDEVEEDANKENQDDRTGKVGSENRNRKHWRLYSSSSDDALQHRSGGGVHFSAISASPDRVVLPPGSSPVVLRPMNGVVKDGSLREIEPLLAASPNILGNKAQPRNIHHKTNGHPLGSVYCVAYTPPHRYE